MKREDANAVTTDEEPFTSILLPVLSCITSFRPDLNGENIMSVFLAVAPFLRRMKAFCVAWENEANNAPYLAAAQALAALDGDPQLQLLQPMQRATCNG